MSGPPCSLVGSVADEGDISYLPDDAPSNGPCTESEEEDWLVKTLTVIIEADNATDLEVLQSLHNIQNNYGTVVAIMTTVMTNLSWTEAQTRLATKRCPNSGCHATRILWNTGDMRL